MSVFWLECVGYDGDFMHGHIKVNYWEPREDFEAELDKQLAAVRADALRERDLLMADMDNGA
jgi:hypothetical protein